VVRVLSSAPDRPPSDTALEAVDRLLGPDGVADAAELRALVHALRALSARPDALHRTANALIEHLHRTTSPADPVRHAAAGTVASALWQVQSAAYLRRSRSQERLLTEQFEVAAGLLDSAVGDPRDLSWLAGTHVRAGALAMWEGADRTSVRVTGTFGLDAADLADVVPVTAFPPEALVAQVRPDRREACFVVPVRTLERDWGLLAVVGEIDTTSSRDTYHYWGQLLCSAFEAEALEQAVRASEERYALATRAANDGLWELELGAGAVHLSDRGRELLGLSPEDDPDTTWATRIHAEDVPLVHEIGRRAVRGRGTPVEGEFRVVHPDGSRRWLLVRCLGVPNTEDWVIRLVGSLADIQERKELEEKLRQGALYDAVTGLPNRRLFLDRLAVALERPTRGGRGFAVVFLDLDGFKLVNDSLGHLLGDELLKVVAQRLRDELRAVDTAARFGGDEFAVLLTAPSPEEVLVIARRIQERISAPVQLGEHEVQVTASVGITTSQVGYRDAEDVLRDADTAMYHAKGVERGTASVFDPEMHTRATGRLRTRGELRRALAEGQFVVHYQPVVALDGRGLTHLEALVRWDHPERGLLMPGTFLPTMEENTSIVALGRWLLDEVCRQVAVWRAAHPQTPEITVSINLSHREFWSADLAPALEAALATHDVPGRCLVLEITERVVMTDAEAASATMGALRATGVGLHIDDFGTGQSSLHALRTLPVDALKIDGSFIDELTTTGRAADLVEIILHMGRVLGLGVIAEQVETSAQAARLREMGCTDAQGWLYASALPGEQIGPLLGSLLPELPPATPEEGIQPVA
uniref:putative bifunctional diguanylate cyclase/phosphodiesterase n=1 Tax=Actinotalea sp. C106 TaxID=2908644 RepID=UPI002028E700